MNFKLKQPVKTKKQNKSFCQKKNVMLTNKNGLLLFVKGFGKRVKQIGMFVEYSHCASIKGGIHFIHNNRKVILFANENMFLISKKRIDELFQIILLKKFFLVRTLDTWYS